MTHKHKSGQVQLNMTPLTFQTPPKQFRITANILNVFKFRANILARSAPNVTLSECWPLYIPALQWPWQGRAGEVRSTDLAEG